MGRGRCIRCRAASRSPRRRGWACRRARRRRRSPGWPRHSGGSNSRRATERRWRPSAPGLILHPVDESRQLPQLIVGRGPIGLRNRIDVARLRVGETDGEEPVPGVAVALEAPDRRLPDRRGVAVAVHEDDRNGGRLGEGGSGRRGESKRGGSLKHAAAVQHWAFFLHLRGPLASRGVYAELAPGQRPGLRNPMSANRPTSPEHRLASKGASVAEAHLQHILK